MGDDGEVGSGRDVDEAGDVDDGRGVTGGELSLGVGESRSIFSIS